MWILTHNPPCCYFTRVYLLAKGIEYPEKCHRSILHAARGMKSFAMISQHLDLKAVKGPSEYLIVRVSMYHNTITRSDLRTRLSPDDSQYRIKRGPVPVRVTVPHGNAHPASDTFSQGPSNGNYHVHGHILISRGIPVCNNKLSHHRSKHETDLERARLPCHISQPQIG